MIDSNGGERTSSASLSIEPLQPRSDLSKVKNIKGMKDAVWSGDGRFDSMGHSAKFGAYTLLSSPVMKIVHFELLQIIVIQKY